VTEIEIYKCEEIYSQDLKQTESKGI